VPDRTGRWRRRGPTHLTPDGDRFLQGIHNVRRLVSGEWTWDVLVALHGGPLHYTNLLDAIRSQRNDTAWPGKKHRYLQDGTLSRTLRRMEQGELVRNTRENEFPYRSEYELTPAAKELLAVVVPVAEWAESNAVLLKRVQQRRHAEGTGNG